MTLRTFIDWLTKSLAALLVGATAYLLWDALYLASFTTLLCIVLTMESRVRMGWRMPRGSIFYMHIFAGALALAAFGALTWKPMPTFMPSIAGLLLALVALSGGVLLARQYIYLE